MATIKSYTDIEQSKKLAEFLPLESADMYWSIEEVPFLAFPVNDIVTDWKYAEENGMLPAWSLAALLGVLPIIGEEKDAANPFIAKTPAGEYYVVYATLYKEIDSSGIYNNPVDACVEMIIKLHEQNIL